MHFTMPKPFLNTAHLSIFLCCNYTIRLGGVSPFLVDSLDLTKDNIVNSRYSFPIKVFRDVSESGKEFIAKLLTEKRCVFFGHVRVCLYGLVGSACICHSLILSSTHTHSLILSSTHTHTHTLTHSLLHTHTHTHTLTHSLLHTRTLTHSLLHTHTHSLLHTRTHSHSFSPPHTH